MVSHHSTEFVSVQKRWPLEGSMKSAFNAQESHALPCLYGEFTGHGYWEQGWLFTITVNLRFFCHFSIVVKLGVTAGWILSFWPPDQQTGCPAWSHKQTCFLGTGQLKPSETPAWHPGSLSLEYILSLHRLLWATETSCTFCWFANFKCRMYEMTED